MIEKIYNDYGVEHVLFDLPCNLNNIKLYPIKVIDWEYFQKYIPYLTYSKEHYEHFGIKNIDSLLKAIIIQDVSSKLKLINTSTENIDTIKKILIKETLDNFCELFKMITRQEFDIDYEQLKNDKYSFKNKEGQIIDDGNFNTIRQIILKQNLLFEPIIYESKFKQQWAESVKRGRAKKSKNISLADIISIVREGLGITYKEISELNIFQLIVDYQRLQNTKSYDTLTILRTTYGIDHTKLQNVDYSDPIIEKLMRNPELDYFKDFDMGDIVEALK